jgi:HEPN domain-containing protein
MKPNPKAAATEWLMQAERDLGGSRSLLKDEYYELACFHAQQSAEKAVKALGFLRGARFVIGHFVTTLINEFGEHYPSLNQHLEAAQRLDQIYLSARYPNASEGTGPFRLFSRTHAEELIKLATQIVNEVNRIIGKA